MSLDQPESAPEPQEVSEPAPNPRPRPGPGPAAESASELAPEPAADPEPHPALEPEGWVSRGDLSDMARAILVSLLLGLPAGLLWWAVAPRVELVVSGHKADFVSAEPTGFMAADAWFFAIAAAFGALSALALRWILRRRGRPAGVGAVVGLVVGGLAGAGVMAVVGGLLGQADPIAAAARLPDGAHLHAALKLRAGVAVVGWPLGALGLWLVLDFRRVMKELLSPVEADDAQDQLLFAETARRDQMWPSGAAVGPPPAEPPSGAAVGPPPAEPPSGAAVGPPPAEPPSAPL